MYNKFLEYLLSNNPDEVISAGGVRFRKLINPLFRKLLPLFSSTKLHIVHKESLPTGVPIVFSASHGHRDDVVVTLAIMSTHAYILWGSIPYFFNTFDGVSAWLNGVLLVDRKSKNSRAASKPKMLRAIDLGANLLIFPEGVWNKEPATTVQKLYPGVYDVAKEKHALVVPIASINEGPDSYAIMEKPFDISQYDREEGMKVLRDKLATAKYELMEKYSRGKRSDFGHGEETRKYWNHFLEELIKTAGKFYDYEIENTAHFREKGECSEEEVFEPLKNAKIT